MINKIKQLLDWIYRRNCYFCRKPCSTGLMCNACYEKIQFNSFEPIKILDEVKVYSASTYTDNLRKLIRGLKYHKKKELAEPLAKLLYTFWAELEESSENFEIIPIPLYPTREKERGYNHVLLLAEEFSKLTGYSVNTELVIKIKDTRPQYKLSQAERRENLKDAFIIDPKRFNGKKLLIIDDICTTGTTLRELISTLKKNKIKNMLAIVTSNPVNYSINQR